MTGWGVRPSVRVYLPPGAEFGNVSSPKCKKMMDRPVCLIRPVRGKTSENREKQWRKRRKYLNHRSKTKGLRLHRPARRDRVRRTDGAALEERPLDSRGRTADFELCHKEHLGPGYLGYRSALSDDGLAKGTIRRTHNGGFRPLELRTRCYCEHTVSTHGSHAGAVRSRSGIGGNDRPVVVAVHGEAGGRPRRNMTYHDIS